MAYNPCHTLMGVRLKLSAKSIMLEVDAMMYHSMVGNIRYLVPTRPDVAFAMGYVSKFIEKPWQEHFATVKDIMHHIAAMVDYDILYPKHSSTGNELTGYNDNDLGALMRGGAPMELSSSLMRC